MNLTGHWKGSYTYGTGYPRSLYGKSEPFEFDIEEENGIFTGTCIDVLVKAKQGNAAFIKGFFKSNRIQFKKTYKYHLLLNEANELTQEFGETNGVDYTGRVRRKYFFFGEKYIAGHWSITSTFTVEGETHTHLCKGKWRMWKLS